MADNRQTIRRAKHGKENPYFLMSRDTAQDKNLSYEARGMLAYLLSKPEDWEAKVTDLILEAPDGETTKAGKSKVYSILNELAESKYIRKPSRFRNEKGRWIWTPYEVYERPCTDLPDMVKPDTASPSPVKPEILQKREGENTENKKDSAPNGAGGAKKPKTPRNQDPVYDAVREHVFGITDKEAKGTMIAMIAHWLNGKNDGPKNNKVGFISSPAKPEHVEAFAKWWKHKSPDAHMPNHFEKFVNRWREWASSASKPAAKPHTMSPAAVEPEQQYMTPEQFKALKEVQS